MNVTVLHFTVRVEELVQNLWPSSLLSKNIKIEIYRTVILPFVVYGCETWWLTWREERRRRVFENRVMRRIFGPKRDEITREWRKLHNEVLNDLYSSPNIVRVIKSGMRWARLVAHLGESRGAYRILVGKLEGKEPLGRPRNRWEDNIKMDHQGWGLGAWTGLIWLRIGTSDGHKRGNEPSGSIKCGEFLD